MEGNYVWSCTCNYVNFPYVFMTLKAVLCNLTLNEPRPDCLKPRQYCPTSCRQNVLIFGLCALCLDSKDVDVDHSVQPVFTHFNHVKWQNTPYTTIHERIEYFNTEFCSQKLKKKTTAVYVRMITCHYCWVLLVFHSYPQWNIIFKLGRWPWCKIMSCELQQESLWEPQEANWLHFPGSLSSSGAGLPSWNR